MRMKRFSATAILLAIVVLIVLGTPEQVLIVDANAPAGEDEDGDMVFKTLTAAVAAAGVGAVLQVRPGRYDAASGERFPLVIAKPLTLEALAGPEVTVIDAGGALTAIEVRSGGVAIRGFTVQNAHGDHAAGIAVFEADGPIELAGNVIQNISASPDSYAFGVRVYGSSDAIIVHDNLIKDVDGNGISVGHSQGVQVLRNRVSKIMPALIDGLRYAVGIAVNASQDVIVEGNTVSESTIGVSLMGSTGSQVTRNLITENWQEEALEYAGARFTRPGVGVLIAFGAKDNTIRENEIKGNGVGIGLYMADDNRIEGNLIQGNRISILDVPEAEGPLHGMGVALDYSNRNRIHSNIIKSNGEVGLALKDSSLNLIEANEITAHQIGLLLHGGVRDATNTISRNRIADNTELGIEIRSGYSLINYNVIAGNGVGVLLTSEADASDHRITENDIYSNAFGVRNSGRGVLEAVRNWWGAPSGPYHPQLNPQGKGDEVSDGVDFTPWSERAFNS